MALTARNILIALRSQGASAYQTVYFHPVLTGGAGEVLLEKVYSATTLADGTAEIDLPVTARYRCELPSSEGTSEFTFDLVPGADIGLDELLIAGLTENADPVYAYIDELLEDYIAIGAEAGGVLDGNYPNPVFAVNMATQVELDAVAVAVAANTAARHTHANKTLLDSLISNGDGNSYLANDGTYKAVAGGGIVVGDEVGSAVAFRAFYADADGNFAQSANFIFDGNSLGIGVTPAANARIETPHFRFWANGGTGTYSEILAKQNTLQISAFSSIIFNTFGGGSISAEFDYNVGISSRLLLKYGGYTGYVEMHSNTNLQLRTPEASNLGVAFAPNGVASGIFDHNTGANQLAFLVNHNGTMKRVNVGAADSGGSGQKFLTIVN